MGTCVLQHDAEFRGRVERACVDYERDLRAFLNGVLRDSHLAEDAFQKTTLRAMESCSNAAPVKIRGWLFKIALNVALDIKRNIARNKQHQQSIQASALSGNSIDTHDGAKAFITKEEQQVVQQALDRLTPHYRDVVIRRIQRDQTFAQIAEDLGQPLGTVLTWMRRALAELREMNAIRSLQDEENTE